MYYYISDQKNVNINLFNIDKLNKKEWVYEKAIRLFSNFYFDNYERT